MKFAFKQSHCNDNLGEMESDGERERAMSKSMK